MTDGDRILSLLRRIRDAARDANDLVAGDIQKDDFAHNIMINRSVGMSLLMASEAATQLLKSHPEFVDQYSHIPWAAMRGMRNRIAHNYFDIDLERVWDAAINYAPDLVSKLDALIAMIEQKN